MNFVASTGCGYLYRCPCTSPLFAPEGTIIWCRKPVCYADQGGISAGWYETSGTGYTPFVNSATAPDGANTGSETGVGHGVNREPNCPAYQLKRIAVSAACICPALLAASKYLKNTKGNTSRPLTVPWMQHSGLLSPDVP